MAIEQVFGTSITEIEKILSTRSVIGEPITVDGKTLIPLLSIGFGFGMGEGNGTERGVQGSGGGVGGGGGVRPVAVIVLDDQGVRVEPVTPRTSTLERIAANFSPKEKEEKGQPALEQRR